MSAVFINNSDYLDYSRVEIAAAARQSHENIEFDEKRTEKKGTEKKGTVPFFSGSLDYSRVEIAAAARPQPMKL